MFKTTVRVLHSSHLRFSGGVAKEQIYDNVRSQPKVEGQVFGRFCMRLLLIAGFALYTMTGPLVAEEATSTMAADRVLSAAADADGKGYTISLSLDNGRRISIRIPPAEAIKIVEGLSKTATPALQKQQIVAFVQTINIKADTLGRAIILTPHVRTGPLDTFAIPIRQADQFIQLFQRITAETKANAAKTP
jgi:hypothetical protein